MGQTEISAPVSGETEKPKFDENFIDKTLRIDYILAGDAKTEEVFFDRMKQEPYWGAPHKNLIDPFNYGSYRYCLYDSTSGKLLFSRGFSSLFQEWKGTPEAMKVKRAFSMTAVMPFPKFPILFVIEKRDFQTNQFHLLFQRYIDPNDYCILAESVKPYKYTKIKFSGDPVNHVDIAFLAEGYTEKEMPKFLHDAREMVDYFMQTEPYSQNSECFNFYAIESPSEESGVDIPGKDIYVNTNINSTFYTFDMDRYLTTFDTKSMYDIAANVPCDVVFVLVNSAVYGGGGFYNHFGESTVDHPQSKLVAIHEFGHTFAGLGDEYVGSVSYSDFYNLNFEPWEPNLTTNKSFDTKWKNMVTAGSPLPTPREEKYKDAIGMFEGGGYLSKGMYSPMMNCRMNSNEAKGFCPVCQDAIQKMIRFYCE